MIKNLKIILITWIYLLLLGTFWNTISADESYMESKEKTEKGLFEIALKQADQSIQKNPNEPRYYYNKAKVLIALGGSENKVKALENLEKSQLLNPKNLVTLRNIIPIYYLLSIEDLNNPQNLDPVYANVTKDFYKKMNAYITDDVGVFALLYKYETKIGFTELAEFSKNRIQGLRPDLLEWYLEDTTN